MSTPLCSICGTQVSNPEDAYCVNGHDSWLEVGDFDNRELDNWVKQAVVNLGMTRDQLKDKIEGEPKCQTTE